MYIFIGLEGVGGCLPMQCCSDNCCLLSVNCVCACMHELCVCVCVCVCVLCGVSDTHSLQLMVTCYT